MNFWQTCPKRKLYKLVFWTFVKNSASDCNKNESDHGKIVHITETHLDQVVDRGKYENVACLGMIASM